jgi:hypothetical protein
MIFLTPSRRPALVGAAGKRRTLTASAPSAGAARRATETRGWGARRWPRRPAWEGEGRSWDGVESEVAMAALRERRGRRRRGRECLDGMERVER